MLLSFSVDYMRPYLETGLRQYRGEDVGDARVKRQTIRALGPLHSRILAMKNPSRSYALDLWWKSRTKQKAYIGNVLTWTIDLCTIENYRGQLHAHVDGVPIKRKETEAFALADGFDNLAAFLEYFVPVHKQMFHGALYRW